MIVELSLAALLQRPRSFADDARTLVKSLRPPLRLMGRVNVPAEGPCLLTVNHYHRPGFRAWWIPLAIGSVVPAEIHWVMTAAWTFRARPALKPFTPLTRWLFWRVARVYGFTNMPPMPPSPSETADRARAVRRVLSLARNTPRPLIGLAPEGGDSADGRLALPASGVGRFAIQLARMGLGIVPIGAFESGGEFCLHFGPRYCLNLPGGPSSDELDLRARGILMRHIAAQLPSHLRGEFQ